MTNRLLFILSFLPLAAFGQKDSCELHFGIQLSGSVSSFRENGITPSLTAEFRGHRIAFGPRFTFDHPFSKKMPAYTDYKLLMFDGSYRYYPFRQLKKLHPFVQLTTEYAQNSYAYDRQFSATGFQSTYGPIFDHDFDGHWEVSNRELNMHVGPGIDYFFAKRFYCTSSLGVGLGWRRSHDIITNKANGAVEYEHTQDWHSNGLQWIASLGLGYRF
jgi:hypothetical protein